MVVFEGLGRRVSQKTTTTRDATRVWFFGRRRRRPPTTAAAAAVAPRSARERPSGDAGRLASRRHARADQSAQADLRCSSCRGVGRSRPETRAGQGAPPTATTTYLTARPRAADDLHDDGELGGLVLWGFNGGLRASKRGRDRGQRAIDRWQGLGASGSSSSSNSTDLLPTAALLSRRRRRGGAPAVRSVRDGAAQ